VECKLRCIDFGRVSDHRRAIRLAFGATEISVDWYRRTMGVIVISLGTPRSSGENFGCTWEHLGAPTISHSAPATSLGAPVLTLGAAQIAVEQSGRIIHFGNAAGAPGNHSYNLSFNGFQNSWVQFVVWSRYLYSYPSTHGISGVAAGGTWEQFEKCLRMTIKWTQRDTPRLWLSNFWDALWRR